MGLDLIEVRFPAGVPPEKQASRVIVDAIKPGSQAETLGKKFRLRPQILLVSVNGQNIEGVFVWLVGCEAPAKPRNWMCAAPWTRIPAVSPNPRVSNARVQRRKWMSEKKNCLSTRMDTGVWAPAFFFSLSRRPYTPLPRRPRSGAQTVLELCIRAPRLCTGAETVFFLNIHFRRLETRGLGLTAGVGAGWAASSKMIGNNTELARHCGAQYRASLFFEAWGRGRELRPNSFMCV